MAVVALNAKWRCLFSLTYHSSNKTLYPWKSINQVRGRIGHVHGIITSSVSTEPVSSISWEKPPSGWIKVNVGSSFRSTPEKCVVIGAVIRDSSGLFLGGFSNRLDDPSCSPICSFRAAEEGLKFAICNGGGYHNIILETNNLEFIRTIDKFLVKNYTRPEVFMNDRPGIKGERMTCVGRIFSLTKGEGPFSFRYNHVFREGNRLANNVVGKAVSDLAAGHKTFKTLTELEEYKPMLREVWEDDYRGKKYQRGGERYPRIWRNYLPKIKS